MLVNGRDDSVRDELTVLCPVLAVLCRTLFVIKIGAVEEEDGEEDEVKVGEDESESMRSRCRPADSCENLWYVVKMARDAPKARDEEKGVLFHLFFVSSFDVLCTDELWRLA